MARATCKIPQKCWTAAEIKKAGCRAASDKTVTIISAEEAGKAGTRPAAKGDFLPGIFSMKPHQGCSVGRREGHDMGCRPGKPAVGQESYCHVLLPRWKVPGDTAWTRSTEYLKASMETYSKNLFF